MCSTLYFGMRRFPSNACGHASGPVKATGGQSGVRTRETLLIFFFRDGLHGRLMVAGRRPRTVRSFVSRPKFRLAPVTKKNKNKFGPPRICIIVLFRRGDSVAMADNS